MRFSSGSTFRRIAVGLVAMALVVACGALLAPAGASGEASPTSEKIVFNSGWIEDIDNLNPFIGWSLTAYHVFWENYDRLVRYDPDTMEPVPGIAESWEVSDDAKTWTFHIRDGVKFQDGEPLTAADVAFTFNLVLDNAPNAFTIYTNHLESVEAPDDHTIVMKCSEPRGTMLHMWVPILPEHIWGKMPVDDVFNKFANEPPIIGSGPFQLVERKKGTYAKLKTWEGYWGGRANIDEMIMHLYTNAETLASDLELGVLDMTNQLGNAEFAKFENKEGFGSEVAVHDMYDCLAINCYEGKSLGHPVLRDPKFRQALAWAMDNEKICEVAYMGYLTPATSILPSDFWKEPVDYHWEPPADVKRSFDLEKANQILDEAGYKDTDGDGIREYEGKPIKLRLWGDPAAASDSTTIRFLASWFRDLGLKIDVEMMDAGAQMDRLYNYDGDEWCPDWDLASSYWGGDYDPNFLLSVYTTDQIENWNDPGWSNAEYDQLYKDQDAVTDPQQRMEMIHRMQEIFYDQCPMIPTGYGKDLDVYNTTDWEGWVKMPGGNGSVANMWNYLSVQPKGTTAKASTGMGTGVVIGIVAAVVIVAGVVVLVLRQRKPRQMEE